MSYRPAIVASSNSINFMNVHSLHQQCTNDALMPPSEIRLYKNMSCPLRLWMRKKHFSPCRRETVPEPLSMAPQEPVEDLAGDAMEPNVLHVRGSPVALDEGFDVRADDVDDLPAFDGVQLDQPVGGYPRLVVLPAVLNLFGKISNISDQIPGNNFPPQIWSANSVKGKIFRTRFCTLLWRKTATQKISCTAVI